MSDPEVYLNERPLGELLVDLGFVHDVLGSAGVLQRAQSLLQGQKQHREHETQTQTLSDSHRDDRTNLQVAGRRRHGGDDGGFGASSQRVLQDPGQLRLPVGRVCLIYPTSN